MEAHTYPTGTKVWIHTGMAEGNPLVPAKVEMVVNVPGFGNQHIVSFFNSVDHQLELRSWFSISPDAEGPINMWRRKKL